jgi:adenylate cyclase
MGPEATCRVVRDVMERLSDRITMYGGTVVNYIGDGIFAMWNAPVGQDDHVQRACRAGLAMMAELPGLNSRWEAVVGAPVAIGIGIHTGPALVGNTGTGRRLQYGAFGMTVNLSSRIQDATKRVGTPLLISGAVRDQLSKSFRTRSVGPVPIPGVTGDVELFELSGDPGTLSS